MKFELVATEIFIEQIENDFFTKNRVKTALRAGAGDILFRK